MLKPRAARLTTPACVLDISLCLSDSLLAIAITKSQVSFVVYEGTKLHSGLTLVGTALSRLSPAARASGCDQHDSVASLTMRRGCQKAFLRLPS